ncbi:MAG: glycosyltransferase family 4 protein [Bdellovibrionota bacterium]
MRYKTQKKDQTSHLFFAIHNLNSEGGQDRSTLEIIRRLCGDQNISAIAYTLDDQEVLKKIKFKKIRPLIHKPSIITGAIYHGISSLILALERLRHRKSVLVHSTGTSSLISDIVQLQFIHAAWREARQHLPKEAWAGVLPRGPKGLIRAKYHELLLDYNVFLEKKFYTKNKIYIAISNTVAKELSTHFGINKNVHIIHHGVDSDMFHPPNNELEQKRRRTMRASLGINESDTVVIFVGAYARKGLRVAIESIAKLPENIRAGTRMVVVGQGDIPEFVRVTDDFGIKNLVTFIPHTKSILEYYQMADIFLLPTLYEPFGLVIIEAMSCGLPSVVSRLAGASELIDDKKSGLLINDPSDPSETSQLIQSLIENPEMRMNMGNAARMVAISRSWDKVASEYSKVIKGLQE